jgi:arginine decarboxylase
MRQKTVSVGLSDERHLLLIFTVGHDSAAVEDLLSAMRDMSQWARYGGSDTKGVRLDIPQVRELGAAQESTPAKALYAKAERVQLTEAEGRIAAEMVWPYPLGIPRVIPGQGSPRHRSSICESAWKSVCFRATPATSISAQFGW